MSEAKDTLLRQLTLLRLIPEYPRYISSHTLHEKLHDRGYRVELRTVQRDLNRLSAPFSLTSSKKGGAMNGATQKAHRWICEIWNPRPRLPFT
ncbi:hypothetical protein [Pseudomonas aeruginosa]|uniref:hypothetical protein n=1 Tax=Pseudomonas aeruginosa TaxID=287 RepID=UPI002FCB81E7